VRRLAPGLLLAGHVMTEPDADDKPAPPKFGSQGSGAAQRRQKAAVSIQEFHKMVQTAEPEEQLPRGPSDKSTGGSCKWVEWDGGTSVELTEPDAGPASATITDVAAFKDAVDACLTEFLVGFNMLEAARCIREMQAPQFHYQIIKRGVLRAMDEAARERELIAVLFASLHVRGVLTAEQVAAGFFSLVETLDDVCIDTPSAAPLLAHFLADAVLDALLPRATLETWPPQLPSTPQLDELFTEVQRRLKGRQPVGGTQLDVQALRPKLRSVVEEYLCSHDEAEVRRRLIELQVPPDGLHELPRVAIEHSLGRRDTERELVCQLLSHLAAHPIPPVEMAKAFEVLLLRLDDLTLDNPSAQEHLAAFLVRAIADEILPPAFVAPPPSELTSELTLATLTQARAQLSAAHFSDRRRKVWGRATADGSVDALKHVITETVREFFSSGDRAEACRCVRELDATGFHHELVKRLIVLSIDGGARERALAQQLVEDLSTEALLPPEQLVLGCQRALDAAPDLKLDNPRADDLIADFLEGFVAGGLLPSNWSESISRLRSEPTSEV